MKVSVASGGHGGGHDGRCTQKLCSVVRYIRFKLITLFEWQLYSRRRATVNASSIFRMLCLVGVYTAHICVLS